MRYINKTIAFKVEEDTVISMGKFDGLHRGHELLMDYVFQKKAEGLKAVVFTFDIPPQKNAEQSQGKILTTNQEKVKLFEQIGMDYLIECPFTAEIKGMEPEAFIKMIVEQLHVKCMVVGKDFHFGHNRRGDYQMLLDCAPKYGYELEVVDKMQEDGRDISSTFIREELMKGSLEKANHLLGYHYFAEGEVLHGRNMGKAVLGIPTINMIPPKEKLLPPYGVYLTLTSWKGRVYQGITNIGCKPSIQGENPVGIETHIFDFSEDMYGQNVKISFLSRVRGEEKFESLEELKGQMDKDIQYGKAYFSQY